MRPFYGVKNLIRRLRREGYELAIVSAGSAQRVREELKRYGLLDFFDVVVTAEDSGELKPNPRALEIAMEKIGVKREECIYVGDMVRDVLAAKKAKIKSIAVSWGFHSREKLRKARPSYLANNLDELYKILTSLKP
jgi:phosphoglycolate phosphatase